MSQCPGWDWNGGTSVSELFHTGLPFKNGEVTGVRKWDGLKENGAERSAGPFAASLL